MVFFYKKLKNSHESYVRFLKENHKLEIDVLTSDLEVKDNEIETLTNELSQFKIEIQNYLD